MFIISPVKYPFQAVLEKKAKMKVKEISLLCLLEHYRNNLWDVGPEAELDDSPGIELDDSLVAEFVRQNVQGSGEVR